MFVDNQFCISKIGTFYFTDMTAHHLNSDNKNNRCHKVFLKYFRSFNIQTQIRKICFIYIFWRLFQASFYFLLLEAIKVGANRVVGKYKLAVGASLARGGSQQGRLLPAHSSLAPIHFIQNWKKNFFFFWFPFLICVKYTFTSCCFQEVKSDKKMEKKVFSINVTRNRCMCKWS